MADGAALLRMLEPTVRPVQTPVARGHAPRETSTPARPFEALLTEASQPTGPLTPLADASADEAKADDGPTGPDPLSELSRLDRVENASLRRLMT